MADNQVVEQDLEHDGERVHDVARGAERRADEEEAEEEGDEGEQHDEHRVEPHRPRAARAAAAQWRPARLARAAHGAVVALRTRGPADARGVRTRVEALARAVGAPP
eukprot:gene3504-biopygen21762